MNLQIEGLIKSRTNAEVSSDTDADGYTTYHVTKDGKTVDVKVGAAAHANKSGNYIAEHVAAEVAKQFKAEKK